MASVRPAAWAGLARVAAQPDAELLARFTETRDDAAFAELVRRHGPAVLAVCRRLTRHAHDAEDAFQAAFLVLARKAARLGPDDRVAAWLYGVAVRAARNAAARAWQRRGREALVAAVPDVPERTAEPFDPDAAAAVVEEVGRLPDFLRAAVVLCELEGRSRTTAARELGVAEGTLSSRLAAARKRLAARLAARGFAPAALAVLAPVAVPRVLASAASALAYGPAPVAVTALAHGVTRAMTLHKLKVVPAVLGLLVVVALVAGPSPGQPDVPRPADVPARVAAQPAPKAAVPPVGPGTLVVNQEGSLWRYDPDGKKLGEVAAPKGFRHGAYSVLSRDGTRLATIALKDGPRPPYDRDRPSPPTPYQIMIGPLDGFAAQKAFDIQAHSPELRWTPDGKGLIFSRLKSSRDLTYEHFRFDPVSGETVPLSLPGWCHFLDIAPDGKTFLVEHRQPDRTSPRLALTTAGADDVRPLTDLQTRWWYMNARLSPDGKRVLFVDADPARKDAFKHGVSWRPYVLDVESGKREPLAEFPENGRVWWMAWSPDGRRVAYTWGLLDGNRLAMEQYSSLGEVTETFLMVADADGRNAKTLATVKAETGGLAYFDWR